MCASNMKYSSKVIIIIVTIILKVYKKQNVVVGNYLPSQIKNGIKTVPLNVTTKSWLFGPCRKC